MPLDAVNKYGGAFTDAWLNVTVATATTTNQQLSQQQLSLELTTRGKTPTMVGESTMLTFSPAAPLKSPGAWRLAKLGSQVDPEDVIDG